MPWDVRSPFILLINILKRQSINCGPCSVRLDDVCITSPVLMLSRSRRRAETYIRSMLAPESCLTTLVLLGDTSSKFSKITCMYLWRTEMPGNERWSGRGRASMGPCALPRRTGVYTVQEHDQITLVIPDYGRDQSWKYCCAYSAHQAIRQCHWNLASCQCHHLREQI